MSGFLNRINTIYCSSFPLKFKYISLKRLYKLRLTTVILNSIRTKLNYLKLFRLGIISKNMNNKYKNVLTSVIRKAKSNYYNVFLRCKGNIRKAWSFIREISGKQNSKHDIKSLIFDNRILNSHGEMAEIFNNFFSTVAADLANNMPPSDGSSVTANIVILWSYNCNSMFLYPVTKSECIDVISKLNNKRTDVNSISIGMLKNFREILSMSLVKLINISFETGVFPDMLKIACITPIPKLSNPKVVSHYRPISVIHIISKIFDRCFFNRLCSFMGRFSILFPSQFGYCKGYSTQHALEDLTEYIYDAFNR